MIQLKLSRQEFSITHRDNIGCKTWRVTIWKKRNKPKILGQVQSSVWQYEPDKEEK